MNNALINSLISLIQNTYLIFALCLIVAYAILAFVSVLETRHYLKKTNFIDFSDVLSSHLAPSISIITPAYNEEKTIIESVRSLLSLHYSNYDVLIINDGSKDKTVETVIEAYDMEQVNYVVNPIIKTEKIRGVYKSKNRAFHNLILVDKENGGKADAINCGINLSEADLISCIDADCILEPNALVKMVKPFMENTKRRVVAAGGVIRAANNCRIEDGKVVDVDLPKSYIGRVQILEYIRAFLLGRMAWSRLNGLLIISGAFGLFDRRLAQELGGYDTKTVGEDMEFVVRLRRYLHEKKIKYRVSYIPDQLCWTQVPESYRILRNQRNRWTRGTAETLWMHREIFFNPKYKILGILSFPFWLVFEWLAPIVEITGILVFIFLAYMGRVDWFFFLSLLLAVLVISTLYSLFSILSEEITFHQYRKKGSLRKLSITAVLEPLFFHPYITVSAIMGNLDLLFGNKKGWGTMERTTFNEPTEPVDNPKRKIKKSRKAKIQQIKKD